MYIPCNSVLSRQCASFGSYASTAGAIDLDGDRTDCFRLGNTLAGLPADRIGTVYCDANNDSNCAETQACVGSDDPERDRIGRARSGSMQPRFFRVALGGVTRTPSLRPTGRVCFFRCTRENMTKYCRLLKI